MIKLLLNLLVYKLLVHFWKYSQSLAHQLDYYSACYLNVGRFNVSVNYIIGMNALNSFCHIRGCFMQNYWKETVQVFLVIIWQKLIWWINSGISIEWRKWRSAKFHHNCDRIVWDRYEFDNMFLVDVLYNFSFFRKSSNMFFVVFLHRRFSIHTFPCMSMQMIFFLRTNN